jgi:hypothetical protein
MEFLSMRTEKQWKYAEGLKHAMDLSIFKASDSNN